MFVVAVTGNSKPEKIQFITKLEKVLSSTGLIIQERSFSHYVREHAASVMNSKYGINHDVAVLRCSQESLIDTYHLDIKGTPRELMNRCADSVKEAVPSYFIDSWESWIRQANCDIVINSGIHTVEELAITNSFNGIHIHIANPHKEDVLIAMIDAYPKGTVNVRHKEPLEGFHDYTILMKSVERCVGFILQKYKGQ